MTTVSEVLEGQFQPVGASVAGSEGAGTRARVRARLAVTEGDGKLVAVRVALAGWARTVVADFRQAWWWRGAPPSLAQLWAGRVPALESVPGGSRVLWAGWVAYNHLFLVVFAVAYPLLWWLAHPGRALLTAVLAVPLFFVWI